MIDFLRIPVMRKKLLDRECDRRRKGKREFRPGRVACQRNANLGGDFGRRTARIFTRYVPRAFVGCGETNLLGVEYIAIATLRSAKRSAARKKPCDYVERAASGEINAPRVELRTFSVRTEDTFADVYNNV